MGHNFTWASQTFAWGLGIVDYSEGIATALGLMTMEAILNDPVTYPVLPDAETSLQYLVTRDEQNFLDNFQNWLNNGADFDRFSLDTPTGYPPS